MRREAVLISLLAVVACLPTDIVPAAVMPTMLQPGFEFALPIAGLVQQDAPNTLTNQTAPAASEPVIPPPGPSVASSSNHEYIRLTVDQSHCPNLCSGRGHCVHNTDPRAPPENTTICICDQGWTGNDCGSVLMPAGQRDEGADCPNNCSSRGVCYRGSSVVQPRCYCDPHYTGIDCSRLHEQAMLCPLNCSGFGICTEGFSDDHGSVVAKCMCDSNHAGEDCSIERESTCPSGCRGNGDCTPNGCMCKPGFKGVDCSLRDIPACINNCSSHGRCVQGRCYCYQGFVGDDCSDRPASVQCPNNCSNHGRCVPDTPYFPGGCQCNKGWIGKDCSQDTKKAGLNCTHNCNDHGFCRPDDTCLCQDGWSGEQCEFPVYPQIPVEATPEGEALHPLYMDGKALISDPNDRTQILKTTEHPLCLNNCSSHGVCEELMVRNVITYDEKGRKLDTQAEALPEPVKQFVCSCDPGFSGPDCSIAPPKNGGSAQPVVKVVAPSIEEQAKPRLFAVDDTQWNKLPTVNQIKIKNMGCPQNCSSRGRCVRDEEGYPYCSCYPGWSGRDCSANIPKNYLCPVDCSGHGKCVTASEYFPLHCMCDAGWTGEFCEKHKPVKIVYEVEEGFCSNHCSFRGVCINSKCVCSELGYGGIDCSVKAGGTCPNNCNGNGQCFWGVCECLGGYSGATCEIEPPSPPCPNNCGMRGKCVGGQCICMTGFTGDDCGNILVECPHHCSGHGECIPANPKQMEPARCECNIGFTGHDCSNFPLNVEIPKFEAQTDSQKAAEVREAKQEEAKGSAFERSQKAGDKL